MSLLIKALKKNRSGNQEKVSMQGEYAAQPMTNSIYQMLGKSLVIFGVIALFLLSVHLYIAGMGGKSKVAQTSSVPSASPAATNESLVSQYHKAQALIEAHQYEKAVLLLNSDGMVQATDGASALDLANVYLKLGALQHAQEVAASALKYNTGANDELTGVLGQALYMQHHYQAALSALNQATPELKTHPAYYALMARSYIKLDEPNSAIDLFSQILTQYPNNAMWWLGLGLAYQEAGQMDKANDSYHRAITLNKNPQVGLFLQHQLRQLNGSEGSASA